MNNRRYAAVGTTALAAFLTLFIPAAAQAEERKVEMHAVDDEGVQDSMGQITIREEGDGLAFKPRLEGLSSGIHGFHVHQHPDCGPVSPDGERGPAKGAGGHLNPDEEGEHSAPWDDDGHLGDLPALYAEEDEKVTHPVYVSGLSLSDIEGHALMIHEGGDNYATEPEPLGGGGERTACGVIEEK